MLHLSLTAAQERELHTVSRQAVGRVALRAHMVLLSGRGCPVAQIALIHACAAEVRAGRIGEAAAEQSLTRTVRDLFTGPRP